jgi:hypothetical protein
MEQNNQSMEQNEQAAVRLVGVARTAIGRPIVACSP